MACYKVYISYLLVAFQHPMHTRGQREFIESGHGDLRIILEFGLPHKSEHTEKSTRNRQRARNVVQFSSVAQSCPTL